MSAYFDLTFSCDILGTIGSPIEATSSMMSQTASMTSEATACTEEDNAGYHTLMARQKSTINT